MIRAQYDPTQKKTEATCLAHGSISCYTRIRRTDVINDISCTMYSDEEAVPSLTNLRSNLMLFKRCVLQVRLCLTATLGTARLLTILSSEFSAKTSEIRS